jgi:hypothetical protein
MLTWGEALVVPVGVSRGRSAKTKPGFVTALSPPDRWPCEGLVARAGGGDCGAPFSRFAAGDGAEIIATLGQRTAGRCRGRRIIAVRDITENKPPGAKTMRTGWDKLAAIATGCHLAMIP